MSKRRMVLLLILLAAFWLRVHRLVELPPGLHYDEAANGTLAAGIAFGGYRPIFITSYTGKEVLFFYAAAAIMRLVGESIFALRLTSAFIGTLTVAAVFWLGCEIEKVAARKNPHPPTPSPKGERGSKQWLGLIVAALLAVSFPHLIFSRMGFRAITQPLLQTVTLAAFLKAIHPYREMMFRDLQIPKHARLRWLVISGIALGLTAYTYLAARLFPLLLGLLFLPLLRKWWRQIGVTIGVAALILAPLGWFWVQNPETFWVRIGQVSGDNTSLDYAKSCWRTLSMLVWDGDPYMRFNIPHRPIFPPHLAILFLVGLLQLLWQTVRAKSAEQRAISLFLLATPFIMILPSALALDEIVPSNLRAIGLFPFILFPIGFALLTLKEWIPASAGMTGGKRARQVALFTVTALATCLLFTTSLRTYFTDWGTRTDNFYESDSDLVALADFIDGHDEPIYVSSLHYQHPTLAFTSDRYDDIKWVLESNALVLPPDGGLIAYPHSSPPPEGVPFGEPVAQPQGPDGAPLFTVFDLGEIGAFPISTPLMANFSDVIELNGYALLDAESAEPTLRLFWHVIGTPLQDYAPFIHILDDTGYRWAQAEANAYPSAQWEVGEEIVQDVTLELPAGMPNALFNIEVGLFAGTDRLPLVNDAGQFAGSRLQIADVQLAGNAGEISEAFERLTDGLGLVSAEFPPTPIEAGTRLPFTLVWAADEQLSDLSYHIVYEDGGIDHLLTSTAQPVRGQYPFNEWDAPRVVIDRVDPLISADMQAGEYPISLILYHESRPIHTHPLGTINIVATKRQFDKPEFATASDALFGENIRLAGYTVTENSVRLIWQAIAPPQNDYTAFVHILNSDGTCCIWQLDRIPRGDYATSRWVAGEYIVDEYAIEGTGLVEIGLYDPLTGVRLMVRSADAPTRDYFYLSESP